MAVSACRGRSGDEVQLLVEDWNERQKDFWKVEGDAIVRHHPLDTDFSTGWVT